MGPELNDIAEQLTLDSNALIGIPLALLGAVLLSVGTQLQHRGVARVEAKRSSVESSGLSLTSFTSLLGEPVWMLGTLALGLAIVAQLASLWFAPLIVVQPLGAVALVITAILNSRLSKTPLDRETIRAILLCVGGVGAFVLVAALFATTHPITETQLATVLIILAAVLAFWGAAFAIFHKGVGPLFYILAAGTIYGFVATLAKVVMGRIQTLLASEFQFGPAEWLTIGCLIGLVAATIIGMYFVQSAHANGPPDLVVAGLTVVDPIVAVTIGIVVLGEASNAPWWAIIIFILTGAVAVYGVFQLERHHPHMQDHGMADTIDSIEDRLEP